MLKLCTFLLHPAPQSTISYTQLNCRRQFSK